MLGRFSYLILKLHEVTGTVLSYKAHLFIQHIFLRACDISGSVLGAGIQC